MRSWRKELEGVAVFFSLLREQGPSERAVSRLWQSAALKGVPLSTQEGDLVEVLFPGRPNGMAGPDFRGAILKSDKEGLLKGDVELHVRPQDWITHRHHEDPRYEHVILHVVYHPGSPKTTTYHGRDVPIVALKSRLPAALVEEASVEPLPPWWTPPCPEGVARLGVEGLASLLTDLGLCRFQEKVALFQQSLSQEPEEEVLYQGIMEALGYSQNRDGFRRLARLLPLRALRQGAKEANNEVSTWVETLLLWAGGFGPAQGHPGHDLRPLPMETWHLSGVRPSNAPWRRLVGMAQLLGRWWDQGLVPGLQEATLSEEWREVQHALMASYGGRTFIGKGRAREMAVNVVLPYYHALGATKGDEGLRRASLRGYLGFPSPGENLETREMVRQLFPQGVTHLRLNACQQQGLMHLNRTRCRELRCVECALGPETP